MAKKKMLIFAHYYPPDKASTGQILKDQAEGMLEEFDVTLICVVPSYDGTVSPKYRTKKYYFEELNGVQIIRVRVPEFDKSNKLSRIKNITSYFFGALGATMKSDRQDYIFTISQPPILGGVLGVIGKWIKQSKLIYCIQDFNPEQIMAIDYSKNKILLKILMFIDKFSCRQSDLVITVGCDLVETLKKRFKNGKVPEFAMINNWIDEKEIYPLKSDNKGVQEFHEKYGLTGKFVIMYSGNIGLYYDLENIIKVIKKFKPGTHTFDGREVIFAFVGAGSILDKLISYVKENHMDNVVFIPYQDKEKLIYSLNAADVHWCVSAKGIKGVSCPSKAYGIMGVGKPVIGVLEEGTEIRRLIEKCNCGKCCGPQEYIQVENIICWYIENSCSSELQVLGKNGRNYLEVNLTKDLSIKKYIQEINQK